MDNRELVFELIGTAAKITHRLDRSLSMIKGISFSEFQLLSGIQAQPGMAVTRVDLAELVGLTPSGVTRALKPLEKLGFVQTIKDGRDARRSLATLTDQGAVLVSDAGGVVDDALEKLAGVADMSTADRDRFAESLRTLISG